MKTHYDINEILSGTKNAANSNLLVHIGFVNRVKENKENNKSQKTTSHKQKANLIFQFSPKAIK